MLFYICRFEDMGVDGNSLPVPLCLWTAVWDQAERSATSDLQRPRVTGSAWQTWFQWGPRSRWECGYPGKRWQRWQEGWKGRKGIPRYNMKEIQDLFMCGNIQILPVCARGKIAQKRLIIWKLPDRWGRWQREDKMMSSIVKILPTWL